MAAALHIAQAYREVTAPSLRDELYPTSARMAGK